MPRFQQCVFAAAVLAGCWLAMQAVHELGHVIGALATGGTVRRVILSPLTISRTDVSPNLSPAIVVWLGPIVGSILPLVILAIVPGGWKAAKNVARFFAGFCLIANGAYVALGSLERIGDAGEMLDRGAPPWTLWMFGAIAIPAGLHQWHLLGSVRRLWEDLPGVSWRATGVAVGLLIAVVVAELLFSPR